MFYIFILLIGLSFSCKHQRNHQSSSKSIIDTTDSDLIIKYFKKHFYLNVGINNHATHFVLVENPKLKYWITKIMSPEIYVQKKDKNGNVITKINEEGATIAVTKKEKGYNLWNRFQVINDAGAGFLPQIMTQISLKAKIKTDDNFFTTVDIGTLTYILDVESAPDLVRNYLMLTYHKKNAYSTLPSIDYFIYDSENYKKELTVFCIRTQNNLPVFEEMPKECDNVDESMKDNALKDSLNNSDKYFNDYVGDYNTAKYNLFFPFALLKFYRSLEFSFYPSTKFLFVGSRVGEDPYLMDAENNVINNGKGEIKPVTINKGDLVVLVFNQKGQSPWVGKGLVTKLVINPYNSEELNHEIYNALDIYRPSRLGRYQGSKKIIDKIYQITDCILNDNCKNTKYVSLYISSITNKFYTDNTRINEIFIKNLKYPNLPLIDKAGHLINH